VSFKFSADHQVEFFTSRRAKNSIASHLWPAAARARAGNDAYEQHEVTSGAGMQPSPALPPGIGMEVSAHEKAPWRSDHRDREAENQRYADG
jgi:hypothetical protein